MYLKNSKRVLKGKSGTFRYNNEFLEKKLIRDVIRIQRTKNLRKSIVWSQGLKNIGLCCLASIKAGLDSICVASLALGHLCWKTLSALSLLSSRSRRACECLQSFIVKQYFWYSLWTDCQLWTARRGLRF